MPRNSTKKGGLASCYDQIERSYDNEEKSAKVEDTQGGPSFASQNAAMETINIIHCFL